MPQAVEQSNVLRYPTKRKRPYLSPRVRKLPVGVVPIRPPPVLEPEPQSGDPLLILTMATLEALKIADDMTFSLVGRSIRKGAEIHRGDSGFLKALEIYDAVAGVK